MRTSHVRRVVTIGFVLGMPLFSALHTLPPLSAQEVNVKNTATLKDDPDAVVTCLAFSPDGKTVASAYFNKAIKLWDVATGKLKASLSGHTDEVSFVAFCPDGQRLISGSYDNTIRVWNIADGKTTKTLTTEYLMAVALSPDGKTAATGHADKMVRLWDIATGKHKVLKGHSDGVKSVTFSPDGKTLASVTSDGEVKLWNVNSGKGNTSDFQGGTPLAYRPNGETLAMGGTLLDVATEKVTGTLRHGDTILSLAFSPDGNMLVTGSTDKTVKVWNVSTREPITVLKGHTGPVTSVAFNPNGKTFATGGGGGDGNIKLWEMAATESKKEAPPPPVEKAEDGPKARAILGAGHSDPVDLGVYSPDGKLLATVGIGQPTIKLWEVSSGKWLGDLKGHTKRVRSLAFSPDSATLASASEDKTARIWDVKTMMKETATLKGHTGEVLSVAFSIDGKTVASASRDKTVRLWEASTGKAVDTLEQHTAQVSGVAFSPDGRLLASAGWDNSVILWDVKTRKATKTLKRKSGCFFNCLAFNPDGTLLATGTLEYNKRKPGAFDDPAEVVLWKMPAGEELVAYDGQQGNVQALAFSPNGKLLACAGSLEVKVWNLAFRKEDETLKPKGASGFASFSPDGKTLVTRINGLRFFSVLSGDVMAPIQDCTTMIMGIAFSRDGKNLAAIDGDLVKLWDVSTGQMKGFMASGHELNLLNIAFSNKGDVLATAGGYVKLWDSSTGKEVGQIRTKFGSLRSVVFSPDDKLLATVGTDLKANVQIWDESTRVSIHEIQDAGRSATAIAFSPKGRVLATAWDGNSEGEITLHDVKAKTEVGRIKGFTKKLSSLAFSPDGSTLASATFGAGVKLWDVATEKETKTLKSSTGSVYGLTFSPDGTLVAGIEGKSVALWDVASGKAIAVWAHRCHHADSVQPRWADVGLGKR